MSGERRWVPPALGVALGVPMIGWGVASALGNHADTHPTELAGWLVGLDVVHDAVVAPVALGVAWLVARAAPAPVRAPVRWALAASAILVLVGWPFVAGYGRNPGVPSLLDRHYGAGLAVYLTIVWVVAAIWSGVSIRRSARR